MLAGGSVREELVAARIDLSAIDGVRSAMPVLEHRRPELY
jgi:predicted amidohydrolase